MDVWKKRTLALAAKVHLTAQIVITIALGSLLIGCAERSDLGKAKTAVRELNSGKLKPDDRGMVDLPRELSGAAVDRRAFITVTGTGSNWVLFNTWTGKGANLRGYLFAPGLPLSSGRTVEVVSESGGTVERVEISIVRSLGESWYEVSRDAD